MITTRHERGISGFTLIEMLVTIGLIILLLLLVGYPILTGIAFMEKGKARADAQSAARQAMDAMTREVAEAMYVFDPPPGGTFLAFLPTRGGLNKAAPITPETYAVRYWSALRNPVYPYAPFYGFAIGASPRGAVRSGGTVTIATYVHHGLTTGDQVTIDGVKPRSFDGAFVITAVPTPTSFSYTQPGPDYSGGGGTALPPPRNPVNPFYLARSQIADPNDRADAWNDSGGGLTRAVFWYPDSYEYPSGRTWPSSQMGYPWLEAVRQYGAGSPPPRAAYDFYREHAVGLTPDHVDYDVPSAGFSPARITEEALIPWTSAFPRDSSRYRARYGSWVAFGQWNPDTAQFTSMAQTTIKVYTGDPRVLTYQTVVDGTTGDVWVTRVNDPADPSDDERIYNTAAYPQRDVSDPNQAECAFGIMHDRGEVRFDFPAEDVQTADGTTNRYSLATVAGLANGVVVGGSTTVWAKDTVTGATSYYRLYAYTPPLNEADIGQDRYAIDGANVVFNPTNPPAAGLEVHAAYRYRNNPEAQLVVATYATKSIINIALTVSKRDIAARTAAASRQDVTLVAKVKIQNVPR